MLQNYQDQSLIIFLMSFCFILVKAIVAILFLGASVIGYMQRDLNLFERVFCLIIACFLITALPITDEIAGILIVTAFHHEKILESPSNSFQVKSKTGVL